MVPDSLYWDPPRCSLTSLTPPANEERISHCYLSLSLILQLFAVLMTHTVFCISICIISSLLHTKTLFLIKQIQLNISTDALGWCVTSLLNLFIILPCFQISWNSHFSGDNPKYKYKIGKVWFSAPLSSRNWVLYQNHMLTFWAWNYSLSLLPVASQPGLSLKKVLTIGFLFSSSLPGVCPAVHSNTHLFGPGWSSLS